MEKVKESNSETTKPTWEPIGIFIGYVGSVQLVPDIFNTLFNIYERTEDFTRCYLVTCYISYACFLFVCSLYLLFQETKYRDPNEANPEPKTFKDLESDITKFTKSDYKWSRRFIKLRYIIFNFPFSISNRIIEKFYKLKYFDVFNYPSHWMRRSDIIGKVIRLKNSENYVQILYFTDNRNIEIRLSENLESSEYKKDQTKIPWEESNYKLLTLTSWQGVWWVLTHYCTKYKIYTKFLFILGTAYFLGFMLHALDILSLRLKFDELSFVFKTWIIFLFIFDFIASLGLWFKKNWGVGAFLTVAISQLIAYTIFQDVFGEQTFLVFFHIITIGFFLGLRSLTNSASRG